MIPITTITGTLGAGKTTVIKNLVKQLPEEYQVVWLKNEYGDINIDKTVADRAQVKTAEIMNGCLCCVLIGKVHDAIKEIMQQYKPHRIIIETAGTAYPSPIIHELQDIPDIKHDGLVKIFDASTFTQLEDRSFAAQQQAQYIDLAVINKTQLVDNETLENIKDDILSIYSEVPLIETADGKIPVDIVFGIDAKKLQIKNLPHHHEDIETLSYEGFRKNISRAELSKFLTSLHPNDFYRIKGIVFFDDRAYLVNYVVGRITIEPIDNYQGKQMLTFMGKSISGYKQLIRTFLSV